MSDRQARAPVDRREHPPRVGFFVSPQVIQFWVGVVSLLVALWVAITKVNSVLDKLTTIEAIVTAADLPTMKANIANLMHRMDVFEAAEAAYGPPRYRGGSGSRP